MWNRELTSRSNVSVSLCKQQSTLIAFSPAKYVMQALI